MICSEVIFIMHHTKDKGDIALMKTTLDLTLKGYNIFLPTVSYTHLTLPTNREV